MRFPVHFLAELCCGFFWCGHLITPVMPKDKKSMLMDWILTGLIYLSIKPGLDYLPGNGTITITCILEVPGLAFCRTSWTWPGSIYIVCTDSERFPSIMIRRRNFSRNIYPHIENILMGLS